MVVFGGRTAPLGASARTPLARVVREYRSAHGLTQVQLARLLKVDQSYVSKIERGHRVVRNMEFVRQIAQLLDVPPDELGLAVDEGWDGSYWSGSAVELLADPMAVVDPLAEDHHRWRHVRRYLNRHRAEMAPVAARLYREDLRIRGTPLIALPEWIPAESIPLDAIRLDWVRDVTPPLVNGTEPETHGIRPRLSPGRQFDRYTSAVRYLDSPRLFENRPSYRMLDLSWSSGSGLMRFGLRPTSTSWM